jgi:Ala-tRNA(Pro) deacylase
MTLKVSGLSLASSERLAKYLKLTPGSVTLLGVINDRAKEVEVVIDEDLWAQDALLCHPLENTSTLSIDRASLASFFELTGHVPRIVSVPSRIVIPPRNS